MPHEHICIAVKNINIAVLSGQNSEFITQKEQIDITKLNEFSTDDLNTVVPKNEGKKAVASFFQCGHGAVVCYLSQVKKKPFPFGIRPKLQMRINNPYLVMVAVRQFAFNSYINALLSRGLPQQLLELINKETVVIRRMQSAANLRPLYRSVFSA